MIKLVPKAEQCAVADKEALVSFFEKCIAKASDGSIKSIVCVCEDGDGYTYSRIGITYENAIGLHARAIYKLNQEWDSSR